MELSNDLSCRFCVIPVGLLLDSRLSESVRLLYCRLVAGDISLDYSDAAVVSGLRELSSYGWVDLSFDGAGVLASCRILSVNSRNVTHEKAEIKTRAHAHDNKYTNTINNNNEVNNKSSDNISTDTETSNTVTRDGDNEIKIRWIDLQETEKEEEKKKSKKERTTRKESVDFDFEQCWVAYRRKGSKKKSFEQWKRLPIDDRKLVLPHIHAYVGCRQLVYQRDFERYLRDKTFKDIVLDGTVVVYDPSKADIASGRYCPTTGGQLRWNAIQGCFVFTGIDESCIFDGYTDETRPDGAEVLMNNGRGKIRWSSELKSWVKL